MIKVVEPSDHDRVVKFLFENNRSFAEGEKDPEEAFIDFTGKKGFCIMRTEYNHITEVMFCDTTHTLPLIFNCTSGTDATGRSNMDQFRVLRELTSFVEGEVISRKLGSNGIGYLCRKFRFPMIIALSQLGYDSHTRLAKGLIFLKKLKSCPAPGAV